MFLHANTVAYMPRGTEMMQNMFYNIVSLLVNFHTYQWLLLLHFVYLLVRAAIDFSIALQVTDATHIQFSLLRLHPIIVEKEKHLYNIASTKIIVSFIFWRHISWAQCYKTFLP